MENVPLTAENNPEKPAVEKPEKKDKDDSSKKKKRAGWYLVKAEAEEESKAERREASKEEEKPKGLFERFKKEPEEAEPAPEEEAPADGTLGEEEKPAAVRALAEAYAEEVLEEEAEDIAAKDFLEAAAASGDIEEAAAQTFAKMEATPEEVAGAVKATPEAAEEEPLVEEESEPLQEERAARDVEEEVVFDRAAEAVPDGNEEEDAVPSGGGSANPPRTPLGGPFGTGPVPPAGRPAIPTQSGNIYNSPITNESPYVERYDQGNPAVTALIGGIIGYFIGRRRGRIRAEKQAAKVQKKLEKQIEDIHWQLKAKEQQVRRVAAEKARTGGAVFVEALAAKKPPEKGEARPQAATNPEKNAEQPRLSAPEASQLHGPARVHEKLAHMLVTAEAVPANRPKPLEKSPETAKPAKQEEVKAEKIPERRVETLNRTELLALSEKIVVEGTTLRQIYETHLIGERGLRRLVAEYLRGGDVKKILRHEIVEHEIDFERDPAMRDIAAPDQPTAVAAVPTNKEALNKMLEKASAGLGAGPEEAAAYYRARAAFEEHEKLQEQNRRRLIDISLITVITLLVIAVIALYLTRG